MRVVEQRANANVRQYRIQRKFNGSRSLSDIVLELLRAHI